jgi:hypothetical protein
MQGAAANGFRQWATRVAVGGWPDNDASALDELLQSALTRRRGPLQDMDVETLFVTAQGHFPLPRQHARRGLL